MIQADMLAADSWVILTRHGQEIHWTYYGTDSVGAEVVCKQAFYILHEQNKEKRAKEETKNLFERIDKRLH
jgi:hypothetical protein